MLEQAAGHESADNSWHSGLHLPRSTGKLCSTYQTFISCCTSSPSRIRQRCPPTSLPSIYQSHPWKGVEGCIYTDTAGTAGCVLCNCLWSLTKGSGEIRQEVMEIWTAGTKTPGNNPSCMGTVKKNRSSFAMRTRKFKWRPRCEQTLLFSPSLCFGAVERLSGPSFCSSLPPQSQLAWTYLLASSLQTAASVGSRLQSSQYIYSTMSSAPAASALQA